MRFIEHEKQRLKEKILELGVEGEDWFYDVAREIADTYTLEQCFQIIKETRLHPSQMIIDAPERASMWEEFFQDLVWDILTKELLEDDPEVRKRVVIIE